MQSLILKSPVKINILLMLTSMSLKYFSADWQLSEYILMMKYIFPLLEKDTIFTSLWSNTSVQRANLSLLSCL